MQRAIPTPAAASGLLLAIAYLGFISLGLPDAVSGVAWPSVRESFELQQSSLGLVFIAASFGYFISSFFTGRLLKLVSIGLLLAVSSSFVAASGFGYALSRFWAIFLACAVLHGLGSGAIDAGLNNFVAHHFSARHMNWLHACYMLGATLGPLLMTAVLTQSGSWRAGYAAIGSVMLLLSLLFIFTRRRWGPPSKDDDSTAVRSETMAATLRLPALWPQIAIFFLYTGLEVTIGGWAFTLLSESRGVPPATAGMWVTAYWGSIGIGRVLFGFVVERVGIDGLLRGSMLVAVAGCLLLATPSLGIGSNFALVLIGLALAPIYPCLMTRTPERFGAGYAAHAIGFQVSTAMIGAAAMPALAGVIAGAYGLSWIPTTAVAMASVILALHEILLWIPPTNTYSTARNSS